MYCHSTNLVYKCPGVFTILDMPLHGISAIEHCERRLTLSMTYIIMVGMMCHPHKNSLKLECLDSQGRRQDFHRGVSN